ncbi:MAG TPA: hypothetical protein VF691_04350 [Cytophagaceae bacterium]|jgi:hypothetical protein
MKNYNLIIYPIYLITTFYITIWVGRNLYIQGIHFLKQTFHSNETLSIVCNKILLAGYYLVNLGYATVTINLFNRNILSMAQVFEGLSLRLGSLILGLAFLHYLNLFAISRFSSNIQKLYTTNITQ